MYYLQLTQLENIPFAREETCSTQRSQKVHTYRLARGIHRPTNVLITITCHSTDQPITKSHCSILASLQPISAFASIRPSCAIVDRNVTCRGLASYPSACRSIRLMHRIHKPAMLEKITFSRRHTIPKNKHRYS